jgi:hypothetical protein
MTELNSVINYEKHFLVNSLQLPHELCNTIKDFCFYDFETSEKINFIRLKKSEIVTYFEENMRFYDSVCCYLCGNFQMIMTREGVATHITNINPIIKCKCGTYSMWLPHGPLIIN